jgi:ABC-2 type transport system ATP-binding protein
LAQALVHDPEVLILDEPTAGLDPHQVRVIRDLIRSLAGERTIMLSTHVLAEAEVVAGRAVVIHRGRIVADGPMDELERQARQHERVVVELVADGDVARSAIEGLDEVSSAREIDRGERSIHLALTGDSGADLRSAVGALAADRGWIVLQLHDDRFTLEETFVALTRGREERP